MGLSTVSFYGTQPEQFGTPATYDLAFVDHKMLAFTNTRSGGITVSPTSEIMLLRVISCK